MVHSKLINPNKIKVTVIAPCFNEEKYIIKCLDSIVAQDYAKDELEVLVIDGRSTDKTREIVKKYTKKYPFIKLLDNSKKIQTFATNVGLKNAKGDAIIRMDVHAEYPSDYISKSIYWLKKNEADCVGGICITKTGVNTLIAKTIALILSHSFGVGNTYFRIGSKESRFVDTVPFGCYKKEVFNKIGLFNEKLDRTDDIEFNLRLKRAGGKILLIPDIISYYYARSTLKGLAEQNFGNGFWVIYSNKFAKMPFCLRHLVPFFFVLLLIGSLILFPFYRSFIYLFCFLIGVYLMANIFFSFKISLKNGLKYFPFLVLSFFILHFSYGFGSSWGAIKLLKHEKRSSCNSLGVY